MKIFIKLLAFTCLFLSLFILYDRHEIKKPMEIDALERIDPIVQTKIYIKNQQYLQADEYLSFFIKYDYVKNDPRSQELLKQIKLKRSELKYKTRKVFDGIISGKSDELEGQIAAGVSDFFIFGDIRDLAIEGYHHVSGQEVDKVLVALSSIGVVATGMTIFSGGVTASSKGAISFLKFAKKSAKMPKWLGNYLIKSAKNLKKSKNLDNIKSLSSDIYEMVKASGMHGGLKLLSKTGSLKSLKKAKSFSKVFGKNSSSLVDILGSDTLFFFSKSKISKRSFLHASTYGKSGVKRAIKLGEKGFLKSLSKTVKLSRVSKIFGKNIDHMLKAVPNYLFYLLALISFLIVI